MNLISEGIYNTGDPGLLFIDNIHKNIPFINKTDDLAIQDIIPSGSKKNLNYVNDKVHFSELILDYQKLMIDLEADGDYFMNMNLIT